MSITLKARDDLFDGGRQCDGNVPWVLSDRINQTRLARQNRGFDRMGPPGGACPWTDTNLHDQGSKSFFTDFAAYGRFLIAAPILVLAEGDCIPRMGRIARHFLDAVS